MEEKFNQKEIDRMLRIHTSLKEEGYESIYSPYIQAILEKAANKHIEPTRGSSGKIES